jgi:hypothetical protein
MTTSLTATEFAARAAWRAAFDAVPPMPPGVALDMVQDDAADVDEAVLELWAAAATSLEASIPDSGTWVNCLSLHEYAMLAARDLRGGGFGAVFMWLTRLSDLASDIRIAWGDGQVNIAREEYEVAGLFLDWTKLAAHALDLCKAIEDAADPKGAQP